jgi:hypothetical protein
MRGVARNVQPATHSSPQCLRKPSSQKREEGPVDRAPESSGAGVGKSWSATCPSELLAIALMPVFRCHPDLHPPCVPAAAKRRETRPVPKHNRCLELAPRTQNRRQLSPGQTFSQSARQVFRCVLLPRNYSPTLPLSASMDRCHPILRRELPALSARLNIARHQARHRS